ncbi:MAG: hypothetical protein IKF71_01760 [Bacilli bacterium]|nr:hypothetical protein [Bacilli bacterium]
MFPNINGPMMKGGLSFLKNIDFAGLLDGASKTLGVVNQAIPVYNQVKPIISNLKVLKNIQESMKEEPTTENHNSSIFYI